MALNYCESIEVYPKLNPLNQIHQIVIAFNKLIKIYFAVLVLVHQLHLLPHELVQVDPSANPQTGEQVREFLKVQVAGFVPIEFGKNQLSVYKSSFSELDVVRFLRLRDESESEYLSKNHRQLVP